MYAVYLESIYGMRLNKTALHFFPTIHSACFFSLGMARFSHTCDCVSPLNFFVAPYSNSVNVNLYVRDWVKGKNSTLIVILVIISSSFVRTECSFHSRYDSLSFGLFACHSCFFKFTFMLVLCYVCEYSHVLVPECTKHLSSLPFGKSLA